MPIKTKFANFRVYLLFSALAFTISANNTFSALFLKKIYGVILCTCKTQFCVYVSLRRLFWEFFCCLVAKSCPTLCNPMDLAVRPFCPQDFPGKTTLVGYNFLLQGIFLTQGSNPRLLHWQVDSLTLSHQGSLLWDYTYLIPFIFQHRAVLQNPLLFKLPFLLSKTIKLRSWKSCSPAYLNSIWKSEIITSFLKGFI